MEPTQTEIIKRSVDIGIIFSISILLSGIILIAVSFTSILSAFMANRYIYHGLGIRSLLAVMAFLIAPVIWLVGAFGSLFNGDYAVARGLFTVTGASTVLLTIISVVFYFFPAWRVPYAGIFPITTPTDNTAEMIARTYPDAGVSREQVDLWARAREVGHEQDLGTWAAEFEELKSGGSVSE
jgi:hypothetical protein